MLVTNLFASQTVFAAKPTLQHTCLIRKFFNKHPVNLLFFKMYYYLTTISASTHIPRVTSALIIFVITFAISKKIMINFTATSDILVKPLI